VLTTPERLEAIVTLNAEQVVAALARIGAGIEQKRQDVKRIIDTVAKDEEKIEKRLYRVTVYVGKRRREITELVEGTEREVKKRIEELKKKYDTERISFGFTLDRWTRDAEESKEKAERDAEESKRFATKSKLHAKETEIAKLKAQMNLSQIQSILSQGLSLLGQFGSLVGMTKEEAHLYAGLQRGLSTGAFLATLPAYAAAGPPGWIMAAIGGVSQLVSWGQYVSSSESAFNTDWYQIYGDDS